MVARRLVQILGGEEGTDLKIENRFDLLKAGQKGLPKKALSHLREYMKLSPAMMAELLPVSERTLQRYPSDKLLGQAISEQILAIAEVAARGTEVFGDRDRFLQWMNIEVATLGHHPSDQVFYHQGLA